MTPSILNAIMCVLDVIFNALLIPRFGVMGAGMGTALACACVSLTMTARCCIHNEKLHLRRTEGFHYNPEILKRAFRIGTPVAVQEIAINSAMVVATMIIAPLGAVSIAANSFAVTAESLCYMVLGRRQQHWLGEAWVQVRRNRQKGMGISVQRWGHASWLQPERS